MDDRGAHLACAVVPDECAGQRLDRFLEHMGEAVPAGLRGRRRLCASGLVLVDGHPAAPGYKLKAGQQVAIHGVVRPQPESVPYLVSQTAALAAVFKPAGWHSIRLAGSGDDGLDSVEAFLSAAAPPLVEADPIDERFTPCLLNRLDYQTSGLLMLARSQAGQAHWLESELAGHISKWYVAVVEGTLSEPLLIRRALDTADRLRVRLLACGSPDPLRHTLVTPLGSLSCEQSLALFPGVTGAPDLSLVLCRIHMGARHQIRAHLAGAGYPLFGDGLYGGMEAPRLLLHHIRLLMPGFAAFCPPPWQKDLPQELVILMAEEDLGMPS